MTKPKIWTDTDIVPEEALPRQLKERGAYQPGAGYFCWACDFRSAKRGFAGRQALRAHIKKHVIFRRAWLRPLLLQGSLILGATALMVAAIVGQIAFPASWTLALASLWLWVPVGAASVVIIVALLVSTSAKAAPTRRHLRLMQLGRFCSTVITLAIISLPFGLVRPAPAVLLRVWGWILGVLGVWLAVATGLARYGLQRRNVRPEGYGELFKAATVDAQFLLDEWMNRQSSGRPTRQTPRNSR